MERRRRSCCFSSHHSSRQLAYVDVTAEFAFTVTNYVCSGAGYAFAHEVGARVVEPTYGLGSVVAVEDAYTRVQFDDHGVKKFLTSMSKLEPSNEPVPAGARGAKTRKKRVTKKAVAAPVAEPVEAEAEAGED